MNTRLTREPSAPEGQKVSIGSIILVVLFVLFIVAVGLAAFFYRELSTYKDNPQKVMQEEVQAVVEQVGQIMILPQGEQPTLATVSDLSQLKDQPFFVNAKIGDKVLLMPTRARQSSLIRWPIKLSRSLRLILATKGAPPVPAPESVESPADESADSVDEG